MKWDHQVDVVIVGSGNGAMTTALSLYEMGVKDILLVEKDVQYGGTSALGGGGIWIPGSHYAKEAGAQIRELREVASTLEETFMKALEANEGEVA